MTYDSNLNGYDRDRCPTCGQWVPWPALDDHACVQAARWAALENVPCAHAIPGTCDYCGGAS